MPLVLLLLSLMVARCALGTDLCASQDAPFYTAASIVNGADNQSDKLAPNAIGTIYGTNLACSTAGITTGDFLPTNLGEATVIIHGQPAGLFYVSPTQINFLVPPTFVPGLDGIYVTVLTWRGPIISLTLATAAPGLFQLDAKNVVATPSPAKPGEIVVLWATGLGQTEGLQPDNYLQVPTAAASLVGGANLEVLLDGAAVPSSAIQYAGVAPGFAGLYQINLTLPKSTKANPEIRLQLDGATSIPKVYLPVVLN
jgi:uncharacterized protein (TIGR03437 family)